MKKRILTMLLITLLCVSLLCVLTMAVAAANEEVPEVRYSTDGGTTWKEDSLMNALWGSYTASNVKIELQRDITLDSAWYAQQDLGYNSNTVLLDGKGYTIKRSAGAQMLFCVRYGSNVTISNITIDGGAVWDGNDPATRTNTGISFSGNNAHLIYVDGGATLTLDDGVILQNSDLGAYVYGAAVVVGYSDDGNGKLIMNDGVIIRGNRSDSGGAILVMHSGDEFVMNGGTITGNYAVSGGGAVCVNGGSFVMKGGEISGNASGNNGGGVTVNGTFTLEGGVIKNNKSDAGGGGVTALNGDVILKGGEISGNSITGTLGGGVLVNNGTLTVSGTPVVTGNTINGTSASNIYLRNKIITVSAALTDGAELGITTSVAPTEGTTVSVTTANDADYSEYFTSDSVNCAVENGAGNAVILSYRVPTYTVTVENGTGGDDYEEGETVTITANAPATGKKFAGWTSEDGVTFADAAAMETTFTMPAKAVTVTATYCDAYNVWVGGKQITEANANDVFGDGTVKYDNATGTLTLTDATITNTNGDGIKVIGSDITIVGVDTDAEGSNTISGSTTAVYGSANITMKGTFGDITGGTNGAIYSVVGSSSSYPGGNIHIEEDTVIGNISSSWYTLQADKGDIIIDGEVGNVSGESGFAAAIDGDIVINGKVGNVDGIEYGIYAHKTITVAEGAEIGNITSEGMAGIISFESDITVNGRVDDISGSTYGVYATGNITVNENAEIGNVSATSSAAIAALQGNVTVSGKVGDISGGSYGIYAGGNVTVGGTVGTVESTKYGIRAVNGKITIGSVIGPISVSSSDDNTTVMAVVAVGGIELADNIEVKTPVSNRVGLYGTSNYTVYDTADTEDTADDTVARTVEFSEIYSITYELNNGRINGEHATEYVPGQLVTLPTKVIRSGYTFKGWYDNAEFDGEAVTEITAEESGDKTFYAKWKKKPSDSGNIVTAHKCTSVCEVCGGCTDAKCTEDACEKKCLEISMAFTDVAEDAWYAESVKYVYHHGIMKGVSDTEFDVDGSTTRAMIVTTLWRLEGEPVVNYLMTFEDVKADAYYAEAVRWAASEGLVLGYSAEEFRPDTAITREQMAAIIYRYAEYKDVAPTGAWAIRLEYADVADIAEYATEAVMYCTMKNLMQGRDGGVFAPQATATRAEIAVILHRFIVNSK